MKKPHLETVRQWYPNARTTDEVVNRFLDMLEEKYNLPAHKLMHADSICCDDVNAIQYPKRAHEMLGPFNMGGLNGFPFAGITGMNAFAHHVPEDGAVFVFYAPHIGVTKEGTIGEINRIGQREASGCCGAARGALARLQAGEIVEGHITELDYQMNTIEQLFHRNKNRILVAQSPIHEATEVMYEAIDQRIAELVEKTAYPCKYVILIGGIYINGDTDMGSFCAFKRFDVIDRTTAHREDLMEEFFEA